VLYPLTRSLLIDVLTGCCARATLILAVAHFLHHAPLWHYADVFYQLWFLAAPNWAIIRTHKVIFWAFCGTFDTPFFMVCALILRSRRAVDER
jgi:hypothetical protein